MARFASILITFWLLAPSGVGAAGGVKLLRGQGDPARLTEAGLLPEGSPRTGPGVIRSESAGPLFVLDLGEPASVRYVVLQADHNDRYLVEASVDGVQWAEVWKVEPVYVGPGFRDMGLRTRTFSTGRPVPARFLRVSASGGRDGRFAVSRLQVHGARPGVWPPKLDYSMPGSRPPLLPWINVSNGGVLVSFLTAAVLVVLTWRLAGGRTMSRRGRKLLRQFMLVLIGCSIFAWPNFFNFHYGLLIHNHEFLHYYLGSKYTGELQYTRLYNCIALADLESGAAPDILQAPIRDLRTNRVVPALSILSDASTCRDHFSDPRWEEFRADVAEFRARTSGPERWRRAVLDHGFNATPVWMILGTPLSNLGPPSHAYLAFLSFIDPLLLLLAFVLIRRTFGLDETFVAVTFFCLNGIATYLFTGGCFLRYDWLVCLAAGICALRSERRFTAGFLFMASALLRIFPGVVLAVLAARAGLECLGKRSLAPLGGYKRLAAGAVLAAAVLVPASMAASGRAGVWLEFAANSAKHTENVSANRIGLGVLLETLGTGDGWQDPVRTGLHLVLLAGFLALARPAILHRPPWIAALLALALIPMMLSLSHYYLIFLTLFATAWSASRAVAYALAVLAWASWIPLFLSSEGPLEFKILNVMTLAFAVLAATVLSRSAAGAFPGNETRATGR